jgi:hypothetical protein
MLGINGSSLRLRRHTLPRSIVGRAPFPVKQSIQCFLAIFGRPPVPREVVWPQSRPKGTSPLDAVFIQLTPWLSTKVSIFDIKYHVKEFLRQGWRAGMRQIASLEG